MRVGITWSRAALNDRDTSHYVSVRGDDLLRGYGANADRSANRRFFNVDPRLENSKERGSDAHEDNDPKNRDKERESEAGWIHQNVKQQNVYDDRSEDRQRERNESINQE